METTFTHEEQRVLDAFYESLKEKHGITAMWPTLALRLKEGEIILNLREVNSVRQRARCYMCDSPYHLMPAKVRIIHSNKSVTEYDAPTCVDCYCPK
jgi:hypothetical protein